MPKYYDRIQKIQENLIQPYKRISFSRGLLSPLILTEDGQ